MKKFKLRTVIYLLAAMLCVPTSFAFANGLTDLVDEGFRMEQAVAVSPFIASTYVHGEDQVVTDYHLMEQNPTVWNQIMQDRPLNIILDVPTQFGNLTLKLTSLKSAITDDFNRTYTENGVTKEWEPGVYYKGIIDGNPNSLAAVSFFDGEVIGVISVDGYSWVLGNLKVDADRPIISIHRDIDITAENDFSCGSDALPQPELNQTPSTEKMSSVCREVRVRFDADYDMFLEYGSVAGVNNYVTGFFNVSQTVFLIDAINMIVSEIAVFTSVDPYASLFSSLDYLYDYQANMASISWVGDVAQLLSTRSAGLGGIGFLDGNYCSGNANFAFSNIWTFYGAFPSYSWTVDVVTHEFGHTLGSPHTHSCSWAGGAIDNCYTPEGSCSFGPSPAASGGTIMSYCHLTSFSKDFTLSFGPLPSTLILDNIDNMTCLQPCAPAGCDVPSGLSSVALAGGATVSWSAVPAATSYTIRGRRGTSSWRELAVSGTSRTVTGLGSGRTFEWQAQAICGSGVSAWSGSQFFTTFSPRVAGYDVELSLVPNPVQDQLQISTSLTGELTIEIYDISGKRWISRVMNIEAGSNTTINGLTELPTGHYTIQLISAEGTVSGRFVK